MASETSSVAVGERKNVFEKGQNLSVKVHPNLVQLIIDYAKSIACALQDELGDTHQAVKTVMKWTGANERTVKNWVAGTNGPRGEHLLTLVRHSDAALDAFLRLAGRQRVAATSRLVEARNKLNELVGFIDRIMGDAEAM